MPLGNQRAASVVARPVVREGLDACFVVVVNSGEDVYEVGDCGWLVWVVGDSGGRVFHFMLACF